MSIRKIIFCDICNPRGLRTVELRRAYRENGRAGRRITEGRAWVEGEISDAVENGWLCTPDNRHICPSCRLIHIPNNTDNGDDYDEHKVPIKNLR